MNTEQTFKLGKSIPEPELGGSGEFFADFADHLYHELTGKGLEPQRVQEIVNGVLVHLAETFAGEKFYVTKQPKTFARWMCAYNDLRYMRYQDVDKKYGWSAGYSLRIQKKIADMRNHRRQLRLPF